MNAGMTEMDAGMVKEQAGMVEMETGVTEKRMLPMMTTKKMARMIGFV